MPLAVITGASSGMGREVATRLARRGFQTVLVARRAVLLDDLARELSALAPSVAVPLDLARPEAVEPAATALLSAHGPVDVLINNAGFGFYGVFLDHAPDLHRQLMEVNYFAPVALIRALLPGMLRQRRGHIINVASMSAKLGPWGHSGYAPAKAALVTFTQSLAGEYADSGVRFSYVNPGIVDTPYFDEPCFAPMVRRTRRYAVPVGRAADQIVGLLDHPRLELCIPRHYRLLDLVKAISPAWAHRIVHHASRPAPVPVPAAEARSEPQPEPVAAPSLVEPVGK